MRAPERMMRPMRRVAAFLLLAACGSGSSGTEATSDRVPAEAPAPNAAGAEVAAAVTVPTSGEIPC